MGYATDLTDKQWEKAMDLVVKKVQKDAGRNPAPTYGLIDSQSAETTNVAIYIL